GHVHLGGGVVLVDGDAARADAERGLQVAVVGDVGGDPVGVDQLVPADDVGQRAGVAGADQERPHPGAAVDGGAGADDRRLLVECADGPVRTDPAFVEVARGGGVPGVVGLVPEIGRAHVS